MTVIRLDMASMLTIVMMFFLLPAVDWFTEAQATARLREDTAQLDFVKTDTIRSFEGKQILCEEYTVKRGDYVWKILRKKGHTSSDQLRHWGKVLSAFNPEVKNLNEIYVGQMLVVPVRFMPEGQVEQSKPTQKQTTTYKVRPGETLVSILRHRFHYPDKIIFNEILNLVEELNPDMENLNRIQPGQPLVIPLHRTGKGRDKASSMVVARGESVSVPVPERSSPPSKRLKNENKGVAGRAPSQPTEGVRPTPKSSHSSRTAPVIEQAADTSRKISIGSPITPEDQRLKALADALKALVVAIGGRSHDSGRHYLPLQGEGQVTLEAQTFPLLEFPTGERIFLDLNDRLPVSLETAIRMSWGGRYAVVNVRDIDSFRTVWQRLLEHLTKMEQWVDREPLIIREPLEIAVGGDWVLSMPSTETRERQIVVVNLIANARERTDSAIQAYLDTLGVRVVDVLLKEQLEPVRVVAPLTERAFVFPPMVLATKSMTGAEATTAFLDLIGQAYELNGSVPLYSDRHGEVTITVRANVYFKRRGRSHLIDFYLLPQPILTLLEEQGLEVMVVDPGWTATQVFKAMMEDLGLSAENGYSFFISGRNPQRNIRLTLSGDLIREEKRSYLIIPMGVPASLAAFLDRRGVGVLSYRDR
ncbi:MAG: LysM peptidoglycan-binding domain-containing protein [Deltaproteobacteria bacterium]|nr:MAG: LysM peptidoglycan-binding domain-containing protein [Deltaproteobacteria bacterium]